MRVPGSLGLGLALLGLVAGPSILSLFWTPDAPGHMHIAARLRPPLSGGLLGTDAFGRDQLSLLMAGGANSLLVAVLSVVTGGAGGTLLGLFAAGRRGLAEALAMRACDVVFAVPPVMSALMLASLVGPGRGTAILAIAIFMVPVFARIARAAALPVWGRDFVLAARGAGKGGLRIARDHVLPNIAGPIAVQATIQLGLAILTEAGLGYLGVGTPPPAPTWGRMLAEAQTFLGTAPWLALAPGLTIAVTVLGLNLIGDGLRDRLDPRGLGPE